MCIYIATCLLEKPRVPCLFAPFYPHTLFLPSRALSDAREGYSGDDESGTNRLSVREIGSARDDLSRDRRDRTRITTVVPAASYSDSRSKRN